MDLSIYMDIEFWIIKKNKKFYENCNIFLLEKMKFEFKYLLLYY